MAQSDLIDAQFIRRSRLPLSLRLVAVIVSLLTAGLTIAGATMLGILHAQLVGQASSEVEVVAERIAASYASYADNDKDIQIPSNYYLRVDLEDGTSTETVSPFTTSVAGVPNVSRTLRKSALTDSDSLEPVTVRSSTGASWIAVIVPIDSYGAPRGVLTVAQPLTAIQETMHNTALYLLISSGILIIIGGFSAYYLVKLSLKPLREIEVVAGRIADGDLSQRIDDLPRQTEIGSLARSLNKMLSHIEEHVQRQKETEEKMRRFISDASHELRTPLAAIRGYGELYHMDGVTEDRVPDIMNRISSEATRMGGLVEDLLRLARLDEGRRIQKREIDIIPIVRGAALDLTALDPSRDVTLMSFEGHPCPEHLWTWADNDQIMQVLMNLIGNIDRYTPKGSPVEIKVGVTLTTPEEVLNNPLRQLVPVTKDFIYADQWVAIDVCDHGEGVSTEEIPRLFERFYRGDSSRSRETGGTGLGLSIVSAVANVHEGVAVAGQTPGGGLTIRFLLRHYLVDPPTKDDQVTPDSDNSNDPPHDDASPQVEPTEVKNRLRRLFRH